MAGSGLILISSLSTSEQVPRSQNQSEPAAIPYFHSRKIHRLDSGEAKEGLSFIPGELHTPSGAEPCLPRACRCCCSTN